MGGAAGVAGRDQRERGAATIWMVTLMAVVWIVALVVLQTGAARVARHRAQSAADLSALAAAAQALSSPQNACARARAVAVANGARMDACDLSEGVVRVSVSVPVPRVLPLLGSATATARARAGPVTAP
ncbi:Rv3654c family TadE-like protein [Microtetraspora malaysiensis]|uniref:Rv3654c family TadE-like protein n=1 Tax=Microtetraspora malaysiensis TaxID=161358 RepID=A0ABW6SR11_9ACTN